MPWLVCMCFSCVLQYLAVCCSVCSDVIASVFIMCALGCRRVSQYVAERCCVLQRTAVAHLHVSSSRVLQCVAVCCSVLKHVAICWRYSSALAFIKYAPVRCSMLQCVRACCSVSRYLMCMCLQYQNGATTRGWERHDWSLSEPNSCHHGSARKQGVLRCVALCCSGLWSITVCCSALQYAAACCNML